MPIETINDPTTQKPQKVVITLPTRGVSVEVYLFGATVTSWKVNGVEQLFLSKQAKLDGSKPIRGGIPLVFPQFGPGPHLPQHGFARTAYWQVAYQIDRVDTAAVHFLLTDTEETRASAWGYRFSLLYKVTVTQTTLSTIVEYMNCEAEREFEFTALMHTYLRVDNDGIVGVRGLKGCEFVDKVRECQGQEERDVVDVTCNEDRVYKDVKEDVVVDLGRERQIIIKRFNYSDIVLWNPWQEKARDMSDFDDDEYKQMVCVEPGTVSKPIKLGPGQTWVAGQLLRLAPTAY